MKILLISLSLLADAFATVYNVGPAYPKTHLRDVPWATLNPGDVVNIHPTPGGYHEIIQVSRTGTAAQHIVIHGVPDPITGALPVLDGTNATTDPDGGLEKLGLRPSRPDRRQSACLELCLWDRSYQLHRHRKSRHSQRPLRRQPHR